MLLAASRKDNAQKTTAGLQISRLKRKLSPRRRGERMLTQP